MAGTGKPLHHQARIPEDIYAELCQIKRFIEQSLAPHSISDTPSIQDIVSVALKRLVDDWQNPAERDLLLEELREQRKIARSRMGRSKGNTEFRVEP